MNRIMQHSISLVIRLFCFIVLLGVSLARAEDESPADTALAGATRDLIRTGRLDDALSRLASEKDASPNAIAGCYFALSQAHFAKRNWDATLTLLSTIVDKYPESSAAGLAPLGKAEVYLQSGAEKKMVATLERIIARPSVETQLGVMDASNTHNRAYELLGGHYVRTRQWEKALDSYSRWRPTSWCGNCQESLQLRKSNALLICLVQTGNHSDAANAAWKSVAAGRSPLGSASWRLAALTLIRLYEDARQRDDLVRMLDELSPPMLALAGAAPPAAPNDREAVVSEIRRALSMVQGSSDAARIEVLFPKRNDRTTADSSDAIRHVAAWLLAQDESLAIKQLVAAARNDRGDMVRLAEVLAAIDTPAARTALVATAVKAGPGHRDEVLAIIHAQCAKSDELVARIAKSTKASLADDSRLTYPGRSFFYAAWPRPEPGSLPKTLPAEALGAKPQ